MLRRLTVMLLTGVICLMGVTSVLAVEYNEAPMLRTKVAAGELPPVEERLPEEPIVVEPFDEIGQYGGTMYVYATDGTKWNDMVGTIYDEPDLARQHEIAPNGKWPAPFLLRDYEFSDDFKTLTLYLRKGLKWSDGQPFTADDFTFVWIDCRSLFYPEMPLPADWGMIYGEDKPCEKIDDYTIRFYFSKPTPVAMGNYLHAGWGVWGPFAPKHYLKKWHLKYNPDANELAKEEGFENWFSALDYHADPGPMEQCIGLPMMGAWVIKEKRLNLNIFERNPYYPAVDTAGNQLPYIDRIVSEIVSSEVYDLKVLAGVADIARKGITLANYPLYKENEEEGDYQIIFQPGTAGTVLALYFNWFDEDPVLRKIWRDIRFRRALSLGMDRDEINEMVFFGKAVPRPVIPTMTSWSFYKEEWEEYYTQYDSERANALLDEMGLKWDKNHEYRLRPDGEPLILVTEYMSIDDPTSTPILELIKKQYEAIGINLFLKGQATELFRQRSWKSAVSSVMATGVGYTEMPYVWENPRWATPDPTAYVFAQPWGQWLVSGGERGEEPPEDIKEQHARVLKLKTVLPDSDEAAKLLTEITEFAMEQMWYIASVGMVPKTIIAKNTLGNVFDASKSYDELKSAYDGTKAAAGRWGEQLFFKK